VCWWCLVHHAAKAFCQSAGDACSSSVAAHGDTVRLQVLAECSAALSEGGGWIPADPSRCGWACGSAQQQQYLRSLLSLYGQFAGVSKATMLSSGFLPVPGLTPAQSAQQNHQQVIGDTVAA
jgi:hypothetical protein